MKILFRIFLVAFAAVSILFFVALFGCTTPPDNRPPPVEYAK